MGHIEQLLRDYGPLGVFLGAAFEGQTAVVAGGFLAHLKLMSVWTVAVCACAGSGLIDQALFLAGRRFRDHEFVVRTSQTAAFAKALRFIERYPVSYVIAFRFLFGLRLASPIAIGVSRMPAVRFLLLNILSAAIWAGTFTAIGFWFGQTFEAWFGRFKGLEHWLGVALVVIVAAIALYHLVKWLWPYLRPRHQT